MQLFRGVPIMTSAPPPAKRARGVSPTECNGIPPSDTDGGRGGGLVPSSPSGVEEVVTTTPKAGRWTTREDDILREAVGKHEGGVKVCGIVKYSLLT
jgi:hypothetical protein